MRTKFRIAGWACTRLLPILLVGLFVPDAQAHVSSTSYSQVTLEPEGLSVTLTLDPNLFVNASDWDLDGDGVIDSREAASALEGIARIIPTHFYFRANEFLRIELEARDQRVTGDASIVLDYFGPLPQATEFLEVFVMLDRITDPHHQHLMNVEGSGQTAQYAFDHGANSVRFDPAQLGVESLGRLIQFVRLGVIHILTGYDHLLFLAVLLLATLTFGQLVRVVTAFTVAHSITLVLAALGLIVLPVRFVEAVIPLTIAYVAVENLWLKDLDKRWRLTFFFGLVHGFGFANVLRELALPQSALAVSLFSFNLGVEIGQLLFVAALFPVTYAIRQTAYYRPVMVAGSLVILLFGLLWFGARAFA